MATSTYGTPYVQGSDLVSAYPTVSSSLATRVDEVSYKGNGLNAQTGTSYTLAASDAGKTITLSNAAAVAVTLPQDSTADLPDGAVVNFYNLGAGVVTIAQGTGATLQGGSLTLAQYQGAAVIKLSANTYGPYGSASAPGLTLVSPTSIANSGGSASSSGGTTTFTTVNSISLNGVFTTTGDNYLMVFNATAGTSLASVLFRLRLSGTDSSTSYGRQKVEGQGASTSTNALTTQTEGQIANMGVGASLTCTLWSPALAALTSYTCLSTDRNAGSVAMWGGYHNVATAYDGITVFPSTGTITGTVAIYRYSK